jgi:crotonobetaine/carnitine-CoA ligase
MMLLGIARTTLANQPIPDHSYRLWQFGLEIPPLEERYGVRLLGVWGMTEVVTNVVVGLPHQRADAGSIGWASPEYDLRMVDADGADVPHGELGELLIRGVRGLSLFAEYLNDPNATAKAFDERGYFHTGDGVRQLDSGSIQYVTRLKDMLKVGGENVAAAEIERICMTVSGVTAAAVVSRRDPILDEVPVAFIVAPEADPDTIAESVTAACKRQLADFKVPRSVHLIDELPERLLGKIAKADLRERAEKLAGP